MEYKKMNQLKLEKDNKVQTVYSDTFNFVLGGPAHNEITYKF